MNSPDRRRQQVGRRKIGYCGHVPETVFFDRKDMIEASIHPLKHGNIERKVGGSPVSSASTSTPVERAALSGDRAAMEQDLSFLKRLAQPSSAASSAQTSPRRTMGSSGSSVLPRAIPGYAGHRMGANTICGGSQGEVKVTEWGRESMGVPKFETLPRMPQLRGPQKQRPAGYDVFLTD